MANSAFYPGLEVTGDNPSRHAEVDSVTVRKRRSPLLNLTKIDLAELEIYLEDIHSLWLKGVA